MRSLTIGSNCWQKETTKARDVKVKLSRKVVYELDGGDRTKVKTFKVKVEPGAISVCVPSTREELDE